MFDRTAIPVCSSKLMPQNRSRCEPESCGVLCWSVVFTMLIFLWVMEGIHQEYVGFHLQNWTMWVTSACLSTHGCWPSCGCHDGTFILLSLGYKLVDPYPFGNGSNCLLPKIVDGWILICAIYIHLYPCCVCHRYPGTPMIRPIWPFSLGVPVRCGAPSSPSPSTASLARSERLWWTSK